MKRKYPVRLPAHRSEKSAPGFSPRNYREFPYIEPSAMYKLAKPQEGLREHRNRYGGVSMTRYHALVLVPGNADTSDEVACEAAAKLLYPFMRSEHEVGRDYKFDWFLQPDDLTEPDDGVQLIWRAGEVAQRFAEVEVEAILTPDGRWHAVEAGQLWDDDAWVEKARHLLQRNQDCLALRHVLHI